MSAAVTAAAVDPSPLVDNVIVWSEVEEGCRCGGAGRKERGGATVVSTTRNLARVRSVFAAERGEGGKMIAQTIRERLYCSTTLVCGGRDS